MKVKCLLVGLTLVLLFGCNQGGKKKESDAVTVTNKQEDSNGPKEGLEAINNWASAVNEKDVTKIEATYAPNAIKVISADSIFEGAPQIAEFYSKQEETITSVKSLFKTEANKNLNIFYELVQMETKTSEKFVQLIIWGLEGEEKLREFEFTAKTDATALNFDKEIAVRRALWMELCNDHNAENLVTHLYSRDALYFNHKPLVKGTENLVKEYAYMNNSKYHLTLAPLKIETVTEYLIFEIGQCIGSYQGKYILIWRKKPDGVWRIFFDSNV